MAPHQPLVEQLFAELKGRQQPDEAAVPWKDGAYEYQWRYADDAQYRLWTRWPLGKPDQRSDAARRARARARTRLLQPRRPRREPQRALPRRTATDTDGSERYTLHVKDLDTGELLHRPHRRYQRRHCVGERQRDAVLRDADRELATVPGANRTASARRVDTDRDVYEETERDVLRQRRQDALRRVHPDRRRRSRDQRNPFHSGRRADDASDADRGAAHQTRIRRRAPRRRTSTSARTTARELPARARAGRRPGRSELADRRRRAATAII